VFYGVTLPELHRIAREYAREHPDLDRRQLRALALGAYATNKHDLRSAALALLDRKRALLEERDLPWLLDLADASNTWAHVDWLAVGIIGDVVGRYPASLRWLPKWAKQKNFWVRRTALLAQHDQLKRGGGDWALFTRLADTMLEEKEFFIRKAIGWVLRETSKKRPKPVYDYIKPRRDRMSGLTLREGAKYLSDAQRRSLGLAPWRDREGKRYGA
jgi:3-methyladenine DNA glycosylase AlkD